MHRCTSRGFTLVELLVVVSIILLLISILLPSLQAAREQAKVAVCLSNIAQVGRVLNSYILDLDEPPIFTVGDSGSWCTWAYGGWSGRNRAYWEDFLPAFNIPTDQRPLTMYALKGKSVAVSDDPLEPTEEMPADGSSEKRSMGRPEICVGRWDFPHFAALTVFGPATDWPVLTCPMTCGKQSFRDSPIANLRCKSASNARPLLPCPKIAPC